MNLSVIYTGNKPSIAAQVKLMIYLGDFLIIFHICGIYVL